ncbi:MAG: hypothetical protein RL385_858 [Pseudomonadota bacterium]|jgi:hypothetical protein
MVDAHPGLHTRLAQLCTWLALLGPFLVFTWSASGVPYWLDSGEFTAAAVDLDISHPPGHPVAALWSGFFCLLPVGSLAFRVSLSQAVAGACCACLLQIGTARSVRSMGVGELPAAALGAWAALWLSASHALWFQSTRGEVYALQAMLMALAFERIVASLRPDNGAAFREGPLCTASFALGLGLSNHHLMAFLALPCIVWAWLRRDGLRAHLRRAGLGLGSATAGLCVYAYLPLRAAAHPSMNLGAPENLARFSWVVSAQVYARNMGTTASEPMSTRLLDLLVICVEQLTAPVLLCACLGLYAGLRQSHTRALTSMWLVAACCSLGMRAWLGPIRGNPDMLGYMLPGFVALCALAVLGAGSVIGALARRRSQAVPTRAWALLPLSALPHLAQGWERSSLAHFDLTDAVVDAQLRAAPRDALIVLATPQSAFLSWAAAAEENARPDLTVLPLAFLGYPGVADAASSRDADVAAVVTDYQRTGQLPRDTLVAIARRRAVLLDLDSQETAGLLAQTLPGTGFARMVPSTPTVGALDIADEATWALNRHWRASLPGDPDRESRHQLVWRHYHAALRLALGGARAAAQKHLGEARELAPQVPQLSALARAIEALSEGQSLDIQPFLPGTASP